MIVDTPNSALPASFLRRFAPSQIAEGQNAIRFSEARVALDSQRIELRQGDIKA